MLRVVGWMINGLGGLTCGVGLLVLAACYWPGPTALMFDLEYVALPWVVMALLPVTLLAGLFRLRYLRWALLLLTLILGTPYVRYFVPRTTAQTVSIPARLKVLTFNTWGTKRLSDAEQIAYLIHTEQPDIAVLQEVAATRLKRMLALLKRLDSQKAYYVVANPDTNQVILSRYPLTLLERNDEVSQLLVARAQTPLGDVIIWNVHAYRQNFFAELSARNILSYRNLADHREGLIQFDWLAKRIAEVKQPLIIGGDFNVAPFSREYNLIAQHLQNAYAEAGWGWGFTFPATQNQALEGAVRGRSLHLTSPWPIAQIDHIFHSAHFAATSMVVLPTTAGSDHRPMMAVLNKINP